VPDELGIDAALADAAGDELGVLPPEVDDENGSVLDGVAVSDADGPLRGRLSGDSSVPPS
jgi:hypothetical protein